MPRRSANEIVAATHQLRSEVFEDGQYFRGMMQAMERKLAEVHTFAGHEIQILRDVTYDLDQLSTWVRNRLQDPDI